MNPEIHPPKINNAPVIGEFERLDLGGKALSRLSRWILDISPLERSESEMKIDAITEALQYIYFEESKSDEHIKTAHPSPELTAAALSTLVEMHMKTSGSLYEPHIRDIESFVKDLHKAGTIKSRLAPISRNLMPVGFTTYEFGKATNIATHIVLDALWKKDSFGGNKYGLATTAIAKALHKLLPTKK